MNDTRPPVDLNTAPPLNHEAVNAPPVLSITDDPTQNRIVITIGKRRMTAIGINARSIRETIAAEGVPVLSASFWRGFAFALQLAASQPVSTKKE